MSQEKTLPPETLPPARAWRKWVCAAVVALATIAAYGPALNGGFVWEDPEWTTRLEPSQQGWAGLWRIWSEPGAIQQYYPLAGTSFWLDHHLWQDRTLPMHVENLLLHLLSALLLWRLLHKLAVTGAGLAVAVFALHPMMVESVGWITERKNVLSLPLFLGSLLVYHTWMPFEPGGPVGKHGRRAYAAALGLFLLAMLAKITALVLPAVLVLLIWWKRGRLRWRRDVAPTLPFFLLSLLLGSLVQWMEVHQLGAEGAGFNLSLVQRLMLAGRAMVFYPAKLFWPANLNVVYPRWTADPARAADWLWPVVVLTALGLTWIFRQRLGRGPLAALLFYAGALLPASGLLNMYGLKIASAADRWAYLPALGLITLAAAVFTLASARLANIWLARSAVLLVLALLAAGTWNHAAVFASDGVLWRSVIRLNPGSGLAHYNLAGWLETQGEREQAMVELRQTLAVEPAYSQAYVNLGNDLVDAGQVEEGIGLLRKALALGLNVPAHGRARAEAVLHYNLGRALNLAGQQEEAKACFQTSVAADAQFDPPLLSLGMFHQARGEFAQAGEYLQKFIRLKPGVILAHDLYGVSLQRQRRIAEAVAEYQAALARDANDMPALVNLSWVLATCPEQSLRNGGQALELAQRVTRNGETGGSNALRSLAAAQAETGLFDEALNTLANARLTAVAERNSGIMEDLRHDSLLYQHREPCRDPALQPQTEP